MYKIIIIMVTVFRFYLPKNYWESFILEADENF